jgi:hypothetical protein
MPAMGARRQGDLRKLLSEGRAQNQAAPDPGRLVRVRLQPIRRGGSTIAISRHSIRHPTQVKVAGGVRTLTDYEVRALGDAKWRDARAEMLDECKQRLGLASAGCDFWALGVLEAWTLRMHRP